MNIAFHYKKSCTLSKDQSQVLNFCLAKNTNKKQAKKIEAIIYQVWSKICRTRNNKYQINYNEARIRLHIMDIIRTMKEEIIYARRPTDLIDVKERIIRNDL